MNSELTTSTASTYCSPALEDAWRRFGDFDKNAAIAQKRFLRQRKWIIMLGVIVTTLAVIDFMLDRALDINLIVNQDLAVESSFLFRIILGLASTQDQAIQIATWIDRGMNITIIIIPILISILVAGAVKFNMGINWVMLRSASESIKHEIFRYRTQVGIYSPDYIPPSGNKPETRDVTLARRVKQIGKRVMETQVNMSELEIYDYKKEGLPPVYGVAPGDDGFSDLTADQYIHWRVEDQFDYYRSKARKLAKELQRFQWSIYIFGGLGTLLAAIQLEIWVAVTSSLVAALGSFLEFKRVETNLIGMNLAASDLYDIRAWWRALSDNAKQQPGNKAVLVKNAEAVIQGENASWLTEMREALSEVYGDDENTEQGGDTNGKRAIAVLPENVNQMSGAAASSSSAFESMVRGEGGSWLAAMQATLASPGRISDDDSEDGSVAPDSVAPDSVAPDSVAPDSDAVDEFSEVTLGTESFDDRNEANRDSSSTYDDYGTIYGTNVESGVYADESEHWDNVRNEVITDTSGSQGGEEDERNWLDTPTTFDESLSHILENDHPIGEDDGNGKLEDDSTLMPYGVEGSGLSSKNNLDRSDGTDKAAHTHDDDDAWLHESQNDPVVTTPPLDSALQIDLPDGYEEDLKIFSDPLAEDFAPAPFPHHPSDHSNEEAGVEGVDDDSAPTNAIHAIEIDEFVPSPQPESGSIHEGEQDLGEGAMVEDETISTNG